MDTIYYLSTCDTCKKILADIQADRHDFHMVDIKTAPLTGKQADALARRAGSYEALISKRATLWKERGLSEQDLSEDDYRELLLDHYTFLKRPVIDYKKQLFIGNAARTVAEAKKALNG